MSETGVSHIDVSVNDYEKSLSFYDKMFGFLGYESFDAKIQGYTGVYYFMLNATKTSIKSLVGIHPAKEGCGSIAQDHSVAGVPHPPGLHHIGIWVNSRKDVDEFYQYFLKENNVDVTDPPKEYANYMDGYYAVFFNDPTGIRWEIVHVPSANTPVGIYELFKTWEMTNEYVKEHPDYKWQRQIPSRKEIIKASS